MTSPSTTCTACASCPGWSFGANDPKLNSPHSGDSSTDEEDDDDDANDGKSDYDDSGNASKKRALAGQKSPYRASANHLRKARGVAGRIAIEQQKYPLRKRGGNNAKTKTMMGTCALSGFAQSYIAKPKYPLAQDIVKFQGAGNGNTRKGWQDWVKFYDTADFWAIPLDVPVGSCDPPSWRMMSTKEIRNKKGAYFYDLFLQNGNPKYVNVDHVYETKFLTEFFTDMLDAGTMSCAEFNAAWNVGANGNTTTPSRLDTIFGNVASFKNPEFVGMAQVINSLKNLVTVNHWGPNQPVKLAGKDPTTGMTLDPKFDIDSLSSLFLLLDLYNSEKFVGLFEMTNERIYQAFSSFDAQRPCGPQNTFDYAPAYQKYITDRLNRRNNELGTFINDVIKGIPTNPSQVSEDKKAMVPHWSERLASLTSKLPVTKMTVPVPQMYNPVGPTGPTYNWKRQAATPGDPLAGRACIRTNSPATPLTVSSVGPMSNGAAGSVAQGGYAINSLAATKSSMPDLPTTTPVLINTPLPSNNKPSTTAPLALMTPILVNTPVPPTSNRLSTTQYSTASTPAAAPTPSIPDPCGPAQQDPGFINTCNTAVKQSNTPGQYSAYCGTSDDSKGNLNSTVCKDAYTSICETMQLSDFPKGAWVWSDPGKGCAVGAYMPSVNGAAEIPTTSRCLDQIYGAMVTSCENAPNTNAYSVNLASMPSIQDASQTGSQVNVGYMSYVIAHHSPKGLTSTSVGLTNASVGTGGPADGSNANDQSRVVQTAQNEKMQVGYQGAAGNYNWWGTDRRN